MVEMQWNGAQGHSSKRFLMSDLQQLCDKRELSHGQLARESWVPGLNEIKAFHN